MFGVPADRLRALLEAFGRVETVGESFQVYKLGDIDVSLPRRESKSGRGHRGFDVTGDPAHVDRRSGAAPRLHVNAISWDPLTGEYLRSRSTAAAISTAACCAWSIPTTFGDDSLRVLRARAVRRAIRVHARRGDRARCAGAIPLDDLPAERIWGEIEKLLLRAAAVDRLRAGARPRRRRRLCSRSCRRWSAARRSRSGTPKATSGCTRCR